MPVKKVPPRQKQSRDDVILNTSKESLDELKSNQLQLESQMTSMKKQFEEV